ncbi:MAG: 5-bromo-4-chloroindolyl phosphate hydrolysis family protein [Oscillospiraceae bacterium]|nr:5-bromo-4-chloroindolyl phosphate hydrolysis family protein [Oscillospiraceae bacterium]
MKDKKANMITAIGVLQIIGGVLLILLFGAIHLFSRILALIASNPEPGSPILLIISTIAGLLVIWRGYLNYKLASRFRRIKRAMGESISIKLSDLEGKLFWKRRKLLKALQKQLSSGLWEDAYIDKANDVFVLGYNPSVVASDTGDATLDELLGTANGFIRDMTIAGHSIEDKELKAQVETLTEIAGQIYSYIKLNPEKAGHVRRLSNYFLPTTAALLIKYTQMQSQSVKTDSMNEAMQKIAEVIPTLVDVFKKQLDAIYSEKAMDVDVEIEVLQNMVGM